jgi:hypothetical protein
MRTFLQRRCPADCRVIDRHASWREITEKRASSHSPRASQQRRRRKSGCHTASRETGRREAPALRKLARSSRCQVDDRRLPRTNPVLGHAPQHSQGFRQLGLWLRHFRETQPDRMRLGPRLQPQGLICQSTSCAIPFPIGARDRKILSCENEDYDLELYAIAPTNCRKLGARLSAKVACLIATYSRGAKPRDWLRHHAAPQRKMPAERCRYAVAGHVPSQRTKAFMKGTTSRTSPASSVISKRR